MCLTNVVPFDRRVKRGSVLPLGWSCGTALKMSFDTTATVDTYMMR